LEILPLLLRLPLCLQILEDSIICPHFPLILATCLLAFPLRLTKQELISQNGFQIPHRTILAVNGNKLLPLLSHPLVGIPNAHLLLPLLHLQEMETLGILQPIHFLPMEAGTRAVLILPILEEVSRLLKTFLLGKLLLVDLPTVVCNKVAGEEEIFLLVAGNRAAVLLVAGNRAAVLLVAGNNKVKVAGNLEIVGGNNQYRLVVFLLLPTSLLPTLIPSQHPRRICREV